MKVSVIIPHYNDSQRIFNALSSINNSLTYSKINNDIIIVDDGSTLNHKLMINSKSLKSLINFKLLKQQNQGPAIARNLGIKNSNSDIIFFTDSDCRVGVDWVQKHLDIYAQNENIVGVTGWLEPGTNTFVAKLERIKNKILYGKLEIILTNNNKPAGTCNVSYKKSVLDEVNGFDESFKKPAGEDFELKQRILKQNKNYIIASSDSIVYHNDEYNWNYMFKFILKRGWPYKISNKYLYLKFFILLPTMVLIILWKGFKLFVNRWFK